MQFAAQGIPLIEECDHLGCDTRTLIIWAITGLLLLIVAGCLLWNVLMHWQADRAKDVPKFLRSIRAQQAKFKELQLPVRPCWRALAGRLVSFASCVVVQADALACTLLQPPGQS